MDILGAAFRPLRAVLGVAEQEAEQVLPVRDIEAIQRRVLDGVEAVRQATESIESHVEVLETLATSLPPLTDAVTQLTVQLGDILTVIAPLAAVERDVARAEHFLFRRRGRGGDARPPDAPDAPPSDPPAAPSAADPSSA
jgi:hypothetical protein